MTAELETTKLSLNNKQIKNQKSEEVINQLDHKYEKCRGNEICCGKIKSVGEFSPSNLKCICKECAKKIREQNRQDKIDKNEDHYIYEKIRSTSLRVGIFSSILKCSNKFFYAWIKFQSKDPFNEHFDHVLPIHYFRKFSPASKFLSIRDSWLNIMPIDGKENLKKGTKVDFELFTEQLKKGRDFINSYKFEAVDEKKDMLENYDHLFSLYKWLQSE